MVCHRYNCLPTAIILNHFIFGGVQIINERLHKATVGATELENVLVVIAHGNHPHFLIVAHQSSNKRVFVFVHILCFVNHQYGFVDASLVGLAVFNHLCGPCHYIVNFFQRACFAQQIKTKRMECLDFQEVSRISDKIDEALLEFCGGSTGEGEH